VTGLLVLRGEHPPAASGVVVRGGEHGLDADILRRTAGRSFDEYGFYGISVFVVIEGTLEELCSSLDEVRRYGQIRLSTVGQLHEAGFALLATWRRPHFDVVLPDLDVRTMERFAGCFGPSQSNPGRKGDR